MFKIFSLIFILFTLSFSYDNIDKGKIDMHGGKSNSLGENNGFSNSVGLFADDKQKVKKEDKKFIKIESIDKIKTEEKRKND